MSNKVLAFDHTFQAAAVATADGTAMNVGGVPAVAVQITGITSATITFEGTLDGTNWVAVQVASLANGTVATTATANGLYLIPTAGLDQLRCRISTYATGTVTVVGKGILAAAGMSLADIDIQGSEAVTIVDGGDVAQGTTTGAAVITDAAGTIQQYLRGLVKLAVTAGSFLVRATVASGGVASGAVASGAVASGAIVDGADVTQGTTTDAAVSTDTTGTISGKLRGIVKLLAEIITVKIDQTTPGTTNRVAMGDSLDGPGAPAIDSYANAVIDLAASTADQQIIATPGANKQIWVYGFALLCDTAAGTIVFQDEDNTALTGTMAFSDEGGISVSPSGNFAMPIWKLPTNKALEADTGACTVDGWINYAIVSV